MFLSSLCVCIRVYVLNLKFFWKCFVYCSSLQADMQSDVTSTALKFGMMFVNNSNYSAKKFCVSKYL